jgi:hypothetical protein
VGKTVYILGAGASHDGGIPLTSEILKVGYQLVNDLSERLAKKTEEARIRREKGEPAFKLVSAAELDFLDSLDYGHLFTFSKVYDFLEHVLHWNKDPLNLPNIEELWGILEIASEKHANFEYAANERSNTSLEIKKALTALINYVLWGCSVSDSPQWHVIYKYPKSNPYDDFVKNLPKERTVITLNYDTWLDTAIRSANLPIDYGSDFIPYEPEDVKLKEEKSSEAVLLLKPHGSFNWLYCPTCNLIEDFGLFHVSHIPIEQGPYHEIDSDLPCQYDRTMREAVIIPPSLVKRYDNPHLNNIWRRMAEELKIAEKIVFIGYSFSGADIHIKYEITQSLSVNKNRLHGKGFSITVVNRKDETIKEYERWFGEGKIRGLTKTFSQYIAQDMSEEATKKS